MANFTIRIKDLLAANFDIWDSTDPFPIYREEHRADLKKKIVDYYYMQEIGFETPQTFKHYLNSRLRIVMPYYNAKYAALEKFMEVPDDFYTFDEHIQESGKEYNKSDMYNAMNVKNGRASQAENSQYNFDTPQNIASLDPSSPSHMSSATVSKENISPNTTYTETSTQGQTGSIKNGGANGSVNENERSFDDRDTHRFGNSQSPYKTYTEFKTALDNIDEEIIRSLADLFMQVF
jgi:hypothetical protein